MTNNFKFNLLFMLVVIIVLLLMGSGISGSLFEAVKFVTLWGYGFLLILAVTLVPFMFFVMLASKYLDNAKSAEKERIYSSFHKMKSDRTPLRRAVTISLSIILAILAFREGLIFFAILEIVSEIISIIFYSLNIPEPEGEKA